MKIIRLIVVFMLSLTLSSCKNSDPLLPFEVGDHVSNVYNFKDELDKYYEYKDFIFFVYEKKDVVLVIKDELVSKIKMFDSKTVNDKNFYKLNKEYGIYDVVECIGIPIPPPEDLDILKDLNEIFVFSNKKNEYYVIKFNYYSSEYITFTSAFKV